MKKILAAIESCETTTVASPIIEQATELADALSCKVWLLHVVPPTRQPPFNIDSKLSRHETATELRQEHDYLQQLAKCMQEKDINTSALLAQGPIINTILKEIRRLEIDLVLLGCRKHGKLYGAFMENTEEGLLSKCPCPIMFVPN